MKKIVTIIGARPQFVKTPLVSAELRKFVREILVHTGQHYDDNMSTIFLKELKIPKVDYNLGVGSDTQGKQTAKMLERIEHVLLKEKPDLVLIYGDTNSTVAGALAAVKLHIPVAHIEAGLRSYNRFMPEEINRIVADHLSDLLLAPTLTAEKILNKEGIKKGVYFVGDVMLDIRKKCKMQISKIKILEELSIEPKKYILATVHRQENTDVRKNLENIFKAFEKINQPIIYPIHPRTRKYLKLYKMEKWVKNIANLHLIEPIGFWEMVVLEENARLILTDSGGVQKEAYWSKVPCITLRQETEWNETVELGWNKLVGTDISKIIKYVKYFSSASWRPSKQPNYFGIGQASSNIGQIIKKFLQ